MSAFSNQYYDPNHPGYSRPSKKTTMDMETQIRQALARGYCHPENSNKELDAKLIEAMVKEVVKTFTPEAVPGHQ